MTAAWMGQMRTSGTTVHGPHWGSSTGNGMASSTRGRAGSGLQPLCQQLPELKVKPLLSCSSTLPVILNLIPI